MANDAPISFSFAGLSADYCFTDFNRFALDIVAAMGGYLPGEYSVIIKSITEPAAADRDKAWIKLIDDGGDGIPGPYPPFNYYGGKWVVSNPIPASEPAVRLWFEGSEASVWSYDGGDGTDPTTTPPTNTTGAMWQVDHNYDFRFPLGAGTSATPTTVSVGATGGEENHSLTIPELAPHSHTMQDHFGEATPNITSTPPGNAVVWLPGPTVTDPLDVSTDSTGGAGTPKVVTPHNTMPLYRVGFWIKRTARIFYVA